MPRGVKDFSGVAAIVKRKRIANRKALGNSSSSLKELFGECIHLHSCEG